MSEYKTTNGIDWKDLPDDDLRNVFAQTKGNSKRVYEELKKRGYIYDLQNAHKQQRD